MTPELMAEVEHAIIAPTIAGMAAEGMPFRGVLFAGLMITDTGPKLIEYNVRFGDPECQVLMMRFRSDLLALLTAAARGALAGLSPEFDPRPALTVVMAANGYPGPYESGTEIRSPAGLGGDDLRIFHAGTRREGSRLLATGGRVLSITALGRTVREAREHAYAGIDAIDWRGGFCRRDIGWRAIARGG
jgi:phosphoribosylamine--glycine ligase